MPEIALLVTPPLLLLPVVAVMFAEAGVELVAHPDDAVVVVAGPLEAVLVIEAIEDAAVVRPLLLLLLLLLVNAPSAGGVEIGIGDEIGGGGVGSGADAINADTLGVFGVLTGGGGTGPFGVKLGEGEGIGTLLPEEFSRSPAPVGVEGICPRLLRCCNCC